VILVRVCDEEPADLALALAQVGDVGDYEIDPEHALVGEHQTGIDDDHVIADLDREHVLADLTDAAQRDHPQRRVRISQRALSAPPAFPPALWWAASSRGRARAPRSRRGAHRAEGADAARRPGDTRGRSGGRRRSSVAWRGA